MKNPDQALNTGRVQTHEAPNDDGSHYDQITGISQEAINAAFDTLFKNQPQMNKIRWYDKNLSNGEIAATILAPHIEIDVESGTPGVLIQIRFDEGRISFGKNKYQVIDRWVITLSSVSLESNVLWVDPSDKEHQEALDREAAKLEDNEEKVSFNPEQPTMIIPGEYSIHRLFASLADHPWGSPVWGSSYIMQPSGVKLYLDDWARDPDNNDIYSEVQHCLRSWASSNENKKFFTGGMDLLVPRAKVSQEKVTFPARALRIGTNAYMEGSESRAENRNPYNCLCFYEVLGDRWDLPTDSYSFNGNLAGPAVPGTCILNSRLGSLYSHLIAQLWVLNYFTRHIPLPPELTQMEGNRPGEWMLKVKEKFRRYQYNSELDADYIRSLDHQDSSNGSPRPIRGTGLFYSNEATHEQKSSTTRYVDGRAVKIPFSMKSTVTLKAFLEPANSLVRVRGGFAYIFLHPKPSMTSEWVTYEDHSSWSFAIDPFPPTSVEDRNGIIAPRLKYVETVVEGTSTYLIPTDLEINIGDRDFDQGRDALIKDVKFAVGSALKSMDDYFQGGTVGFRYPGRSELTFERLYLPSVQDAIFADIMYMYPKESRVSWLPPDPGDSDDSDSTPGDEYTSDPSVTDDIPYITWTSSIRSYDPGTQKVHLILTASNTSSESVAFKSVKAMFLRMKDIDDNAFFNVNWEEWAQETEPTATSTETWSITADNIGQELSVKAEAISNGLQFKVFPTVLEVEPDGKELPEKFIILAGGSFTLTLNGTVHTEDDAGLYVVQLNEIWDGVKPGKPLVGRADAFMVLELKAGGQTTTPYLVSQQEADRIRGVPQN